MQEYGFYWQYGTPSPPEFMHHSLSNPYWKLKKSTVKIIGEYISDAADYLQGAKEKTKMAIEDFAVSTAINVTVLTAKTLNQVEETTSFVADAAGHVQWVFNSTTGNGYLKLILNSVASSSTPINIPVEATSIQFNYEFLTGCDTQTQIEVFLNDKLIFTAFAADILEVGEQLSGWINVMDYAGQQVDLTYRLSNPVDGPLGEIAIDDIIFAKLSSMDMQIQNSFPWPMFLPAIFGGQ